MKTIIKTINNTALLAVCLFLSVLSVKADDVQESINLDYLRTPEAAAFKKYGEESVNEYTGTADISVPLYTVRCVRHQGGARSILGWSRMEHVGRRLHQLCMCRWS